MIVTLSGPHETKSPAIWLSVFVIVMLMFWTGVIYVLSGWILRALRAFSLSRLSK